VTSIVKPPSINFRLVNKRKGEAPPQNTASCLTLIMACIIYWQTKEISRVILERDPEDAGLGLSLLERISPIGWENIILVGEYVLDPALVLPG